MATIPEHIKNLLFEQDCVIIPDFGGFITHFHGAVLQHPNGTYLPPRKRVAFNEALQLDDALLSSYIAFKEEKSREEVLHRLRSFTEHIRKELKFRKSFRFENLGVFTLNTEGKLVFEPDHKINYFAESYGMAPVVPRYLRKPQGPARAEAVVLPFRPDVPEVEAEVLNTDEFAHQPLRRSWVTLPNVAAAVGIVALSLVGWAWFKGGDSGLSSFNPFTLISFGTREEVAQPVDTARLRPQSASQPLAVVVQPVVAQPDTTASDGWEDEALNQSAVAPAPKPAETKPPVVEKPIEKLPVVVENAPVLEKGPRIPVISMTVKTAEGTLPSEAVRYYVVAGGFGKESNARNYRQRLAGQGFQGASILFPAEKGLVKVTLADFDNPEAAIQLARQVRSQFGNTVWVLKTKP